MSSSSPTDAEVSSVLSALDPPAATPAEDDPKDEAEGQAEDPKEESEDSAEGAEESEAEPEESAEEEAESEEGEEEEAEASEDEEGEEADDTQVDLGNGEAVPLSELVKGYQRNKDYTQKTMALATQRHEVEALQEQLSTERMTVAQRMGQIAQHLQGVLADQREPDWDSLREEDPVEYTRLSTARREKQEALQMVQAEQAQMIAQERTRRIPMERDLLVEKVPEWREPEKFRAGYSALTRYLIQGGWVEPQEWDEVIDHRLVALAEKARRYDEAARKKPHLQKAVAKKLKVLPKVSKPGAPREAAAEKAKRDKAVMSRLKKSGSINDAADAIMGLL